MQLFGPVLALLARILMAFAFSFFVPLAWAWYEDAMALRAVAPNCMVVRPPASAPSATQPAILNLEVMASVCLFEPAMQACHPAC